MKAGVEDTTSDAVLAWAPAYENYRFMANGEGTELQVSVDTTPGFESYMNNTFPKALKRLKSMCESAP